MAYAVHRTGLFYIKIQGISVTQLSCLRDGLRDSESEAIALFGEPGFHLRLRIYDVQAHDMPAYTMRRRLYIFMLGIELCSIAWSSPMPGLQTLAGSVSNG